MATPPQGSASGPKGRPTKTHPKIRLPGSAPAAPTGGADAAAGDAPPGPDSSPAPGLLTRLTHSGNGLGWLLVCGAAAALMPSEYTYHRVGVGVGGLASLPGPTALAIRVPWFGWLGAGIAGWVLLAWFEGRLLGVGGGLAKTLVSLVILGVAAGFVAAIYWPLIEAGLLWPSGGVRK
ncbi:MAG: hypothetical protein L0216_18905 [Planctomycetales bacterium]|nr:hypothetical protein [Planctomycetales bacterium]